MKTATKPKPQALPHAGADAATDGTVLAQLAALQRLSVNELKAKWEDFFATAEPVAELGPRRSGSHCGWPSLG